MTERAVLSGLLYGICVYFVMNFVVLPLSAFPTPITHTPSRMAINIVAHMLLFGLPIALAARAASRAPMREAASNDAQSPTRRQPK
jgi:uncharacterized membrane protein YagU involved in acid resistance